MGEIPYSVKRRGGAEGPFAIVFACPGCGKELGAPIERAGRDEHCSVCGAMFVCPGVDAPGRVQRELNREDRAREAEAEERERVRPAIEAMRERAEDPFGVPVPGRVTGAETAVIVRRMRFVSEAMSWFAAIVLAIVLVFGVQAFRSLGAIESGFDAVFVMGALLVCAMWMAVALLLFGGAQLLAGTAQIARLVHQRLGEPEDPGE